MLNKKTRIVIIIGVIYLTLLVSVSAVKELKNKPLASNGTTATINETEGLTTISPKSEEDTPIEIPTELVDPTDPTAPIEEVPGEEPTTGDTTTSGTTTSKKTTSTTKKTTTTTKAIPSKIDCGSRQIIKMSREEILSKIGHPYNSNTCLKWNGFIKGSKDTFDGSIPTEWLGDPVYVSMATPAEVRSEYMIGANRDNAHDTGISQDKLRLKQVAIGAIYLTKGGSLPNTFTINYGKIKLFGYSKSKGKWVIIDSQPHPKMVMQYQLPWTAHLPTTDFTSKFVDHGSYVSITYNKEEIDDTHIMHFWGQLTDYDKSDYLYYASAFEVWTSTSGAVGSLTATSGIDTKDKAGGDALQLFSSYGMKVTTSKRVLWGHTIPMSEYDYYRDGVQLQKLFSQN